MDVRVVTILSGGNIDTTILGRCLERGLAAEKRLIKFNVTISDRPGGISELCTLLSGLGISIKDIIQERAWVMRDVFSVRVKVICEIRGPQHLNDLKARIDQQYTDYRFGSGREAYEEGNKRGSTVTIDDII